VVSQTRNYSRWATVAAAVLIWQTVAGAGVLFTFPDFSSTAGLTFAGAATTTTTSDGAVLRVTPATGGQSGAAYSTTAVPLGPGDTFSTVFQFRFTDPGGIDPADGITFVLAATATGLGSGGGFIGYGGVPNSVAIEFDTFNNGGGDGNSSNHVGIDTNGVLTDTSLTNVYGMQTCNFSASTINTAAGCMSNGNVWTATITYDGSNLSVNLKDSAEGSTFNAISSFPIDIKSFLGTSNAFVGFTSGTGAGWENHDILNWTFSNSATLPGTVPEPGTWVLLGSGLLLVPLVSRLRRRRS
jgi:hypothetical protein